MLHQLNHVIKKLNLQSFYMYEAPKM